MTSRAGLYLDAVRHMRLRQLTARARRLVPPALLAGGLTPTEPPAWRPLAAGLGVDPAPQSGPVPPPHEVGAFDAVGRSRPWGSPRFWTDRGDGLLFLFHLHGFRELARYAAAPPDPSGDSFWTGVVDSWLAEHERPSAPAWHPYPTSERILSWAAALSREHPWPADLSTRMRRELWREVRYLRRSVEHDIGGNHVLKNAVALVVGAAACGSPGLLDGALRLLRHECAAQMLPDGGHEERSPAYHREITADLEDVAVVLDRGGAAVPDWLARVRASAARWLTELAGPDGALPLLNDAWEGPPVPHATGPAATWLADTGYAVLRSGDDQIVFDAGKLCPPHLPPHAHADVGSFVLWADGRQLIVDPGSFAYAGPERRRYRSTAMHNTVEVGGADQAELWGDFRAAFLPHVAAEPPRRDGEAVVVGVSHDGYRRLEAPARHRRTIVWLPEAGLAIVDRLDATQHVRSLLHLAPGVDTRREGDEVRAGALSIAPLTAGGTVTTEQYRYAPYLGAGRQATVIAETRPVTADERFGWALLRAGASARLDGERLEIAGPSGASAAVTLR